MARKDISQRDLANQIGWSQPRVGKLLTGATKLCLDDLETVCLALGISPVETIRDHGLEFLAEMTPTELRILERIRQLPTVLDAILTLLNVNRTTAPQGRRARSVTRPTSAAHAPKSKKVAKKDPAE